MFPTEIPRVIYNKNPLVKVICQLRFPPILKIDAQIPDEFQERIRKDFPNFSEKTEDLEMTISKEVNMPIPSEILREVRQTSGIKNYEFSSEDEQWKVNLTRTFIALSSTKYRTWEEFSAKLDKPLKALVEIYSPQNFSRVGLRYTDVINRPELDLTGRSWGELLNPHVLGILSSDYDTLIEKFESKHEMRLPDGESMIRVIARLAPIDNENDSCFVIDSDSYNTNKISLEGSMEKLDYFNECASRFFRWCITDILHQAMEPEKL